jgi:hypothetical protein
MEKNHHHAGKNHFEIGKKKKKKKKIESTKCRRKTTPRYRGCLRRSPRSPSSAAAGHCRKNMPRGSRRRSLAAQNAAFRPRGSSSLHRLRPPFYDSPTLKFYISYITHHTYPLPSVAVAIRAAQFSQSLPTAPLVFRGLSRPRHPVLCTTGSCVGEKKKKIGGRMSKKKKKKKT